MQPFWHMAQKAALQQACGVWPSEPLQAHRVQALSKGLSKSSGLLTVLRGNRHNDESYCFLHV